MRPSRTEAGCSESQVGNGKIDVKPLLDRGLGPESDEFFGSDNLIDDDEMKPVSLAH